MYNEKVMEHYRNPRNMGELKDADIKTKVTSPVCGDVMEIQLKVKNNKIIDIKFQTLGCAASVATGSMLTEIVKEKTIEEALEITAKGVENALGGLPVEKMHCSRLAVDTLHKAIEDYKSKSSK